MSDVMFPTSHSPAPDLEIDEQPTDEESLHHKSYVIMLVDELTSLYSEPHSFWSLSERLSCNPQKKQNHKYQIHTSHKRRRKHFCRRSATSFTRAIGPTTATCVHAGAILVAVQRWMETPWTIHNTAERPFSNLHRLWELCELRRDCPHNK